jgi:hypothetical protein
MNIISACLCDCAYLSAALVAQGLRCKWPSRANAPFYAVRASSPKHRIPGCGRSSAVNAQTSQSELSLADAMHQLDAGDRDRRIPESFET